MRPTSVALLLTLCAVVHADDAPPAARPVREIRVRIACDEEYRRRADWRDDAFRRVREASVGWEAEFGIRWIPTECVEWTSDDAAALLQDLRIRLAAEVAPGAADVVLGLVGQDRAKGAARRGYAALGNTQYFDRVAMAGADWPGRPRNEVSAIAHEFGHLFGAWHAARPGTVMTNPSGSTLLFDDETRELIPLVRDLDFTKGLDGLDDATIRAIDKIWRTGHADDADHPVGDALVERAGDHWRAGEHDLAAADYARAIALVEAADGPDSKRLVRALVWSSRLCWVHTRADPARELQLARRARGIAEKHGLVEDPIADSWIQLAHARWTNGDAEGAIAAHAVALKLCREALGASHARTLEEAKSLKWFASRGFESAKKALAEFDGEPAKKR